MMKSYLPNPILGVFYILFLFYSCVKDTDFDAADDILINPVLEADLVYLDLEASDFSNAELINGTVTVTDTTEIRFINSSELGKNINRIEFTFRFENRIPRPFAVNFEFLNDNNVLKYQILGNVSPGMQNTPIITEIIENVEGDDLIQLTKALKLAISLTMPDPDENLSGNLNMKSKATYYLEF